MSNIRAIKAISFLWLSSLLAAGFAFLTQVVLARVLGAEDFGRFSSALATVMLCVPLAGFGVAPFWLKVFGEEGWRARRWWKGSFSFISISTTLVILGLISWGVWGPHDGVMSQIIVLLVFYVLGQLSLELVGGKLQLEERYFALAVWQVLPHLSRFILVAMFWLFLSYRFSAYGAALIYSSVSIIFFLLGLHALIRTYCGNFKLAGHGAEQIDGEATEPSFIQVWREAWPFGAGSVFYFIYFQSAVIILGYLSGAEAAGIYNVAFIVMAAVYLFPSVLYQKFLLPKIHRWANNNRELLAESYRRGNFYMFIAGLIAMVFVWLCSFWGMPWLFGEGFLDAISVINILAIAAPFRFLATSVGSVLVTKNHMKRKVWYMGTVAILNLALNIYMIPIYGVLGAAIATVISDVVLLAFYFYSVKRHVLNGASS